VAFGETNPIRIGYEWTVKEGGRSEAEREVKQQLPGGGTKQISATDNLADPHGMVINHNGELVGGEIIVTPDNEIPEIAASHERLFAFTAVDKRNGFSIGHAKTPVDRRRTLGAAHDRRTLRLSVHSSVGRRPTGARVDRFVVTFMRRVQGLEDVLARAATGIHVSGLDQLFEGAAVMILTLALGIGAERAATVGAFSPLDPNP
jgi:hypothetical protein